MVLWVRRKKFKWETHLKILAAIFAAFMLLCGIHLGMWRQHYAWSADTDTEAQMKAWDHVFQFWDWP